MKFSASKFIGQEEIHRMAQSMDVEERIEAANQLYDNFAILPDKIQGSSDLHRLAKDNDGFVLFRAAYALGKSFPNVHNKHQAWDDIKYLMHRDDAKVAALDGLYDTFFSQLPDKMRAWTDVHFLSQNKEFHVRWRMVSIIESNFTYIPLKEQAWADLIRLSEDEEKQIRASAIYSLGKISIYKATEADSKENFKKELEKALDFFEKSVKEPPYNNPAIFCLPFYKSIHTITFEKTETNVQIQKYLDEAKKAIGGSECKEQLLEILETLANALFKAKNAREMDLDVMRLNLNAHRLYIKEAEDLLSKTLDKAPSATKLIKKGLPIIDQKIKDIIKEIQEKASIACQQSKGTKAEEIACAANREVQKWQIGDLEQMTQNVENLIFVLSSKVPHALEFKNIHKEIEHIRMEPDITKQYQKISYIIADTDF